MTIPQKRLSLGFIGGGLSSTAGQVHFAASALDGRWRLVAGAFSRDGETCERTAQAWGVMPERSYDCWRKLIDNEKNRLDAVVVLLPTPDHKDVVIQLLKAHIPVICEKSLATDMTEMAEIEQVCKAYKGFLAVTFNYSGYPLIRELKARIASGELGSIQQIQFEMPQEGFVRPPNIAGKAAPPQSWRLKDDVIPMISHDLGAHLYHLAYFLTGEEPQSTIADYAIFSAYTEIVDDVKIWLKYASGMRGAFWFSKAAIGCRNGMRLRVFGSKASADWVQMSPEELRLSYLDGRVCLIDRGANQNLVAEELRYNRMKPGHPSGFIESFANLYVDIADQLLAYQSGDIPGFAFSSDFVYGAAHSASCIRFFDAVSLANSKQAWVSLEPCSRS